jgi:peptidyl-tRNA hydrolase
MYILVNTEKLKKNKTGKISSQVGHAVQKITEYLLHNNKKRLKEYNNNCTKVVLSVSSEILFLEILEQTQDIYKTYVIDAGLTCCEPGTLTAVGYIPLFEYEIPKIIKNLPIL